jgi:glycosyltransferase involved in cell wall biosynthesis
LKILQLCLRIPYPPNDGGSIAIYNLQRSLLAQDVSLKVIAFNTIKHYVEPDSLPEEYVNSVSLESVYLDNRVKPFAALLNLFTRDSYNIVRFIRRDFDDLLKETLRKEVFDIIQIESLFMVPYLETIQRNSGAKVVLRAHNIEHLIWERMAVQETKPVRKWYLNLLAKRLRQYEVWALNRVDAVAAMTAEDELAIRELGGIRPVHIAPIGINVNEYSSVNDYSQPVVFHIGAMDWLPNREGIEWLLEMVWPKLKVLCPEAKLRLAGRDMPKRFFRYADERCSIEEFVPDAQLWMNQGNIMAVPLFSGSGMRVKILEGMATGKPVVTTPVGIEGIPARHGVEVMVADDPGTFAGMICELIRDPEKAKTIGEAGKKMVSEKFDNAVIAKKLIDFYKQGVSRSWPVSH